MAITLNNSLRLCVSNDLSVRPFTSQAAIWLYGVPVVKDIIKMLTYICCLRGDARIIRVMRRVSVYQMSQGLSIEIPFTLFMYIIMYAFL